MLEEMNTFHRQLGVTLTEALVSILVLAILVTIAAPAFTGLLERNRLKAAGDQLYTDLYWARSESVKGNRDITISVSSGTTWAYGIGTSNTCACTAGACTNCDLKVVTGTEYTGISISASTLAATITPRQGQASAAGEATFQNSQSAQLRVNLSLLGQPRICSPSSTLPGYPSCP